MFLHHRIRIPMFVAIGLLVGVPTLWLAVLWVPEWMVNHYGAHGELTRDQYTRHVGEYRIAVVQYIVGIVGALGVFNLWKQARSAQTNVNLTKEMNFDLRFSKAIEQLGASDKDGNKVLPVRLGAIYALEGIARDSERYRKQVMETLTAYVRMKETATAGERSAGAPDHDIQAIVTVLGRRNIDKDWPLNLSGADLRRVNFTDGDFEHCDFTESLLDGAILVNSQLAGSSFRSASLSSAVLTAAKLDRASFDRAVMSNCHLVMCHADHTTFMRTDLTKANLQQVYGVDANFGGAKLEGASLILADFAGAYFGNYHGSTQFPGANNYLDEEQMAILNGADFSNTNLEGANFAGASLLNARFKKARLRRAYFGRTNLTSTDFTDSNWMEAKFEDAIGEPRAENDPGA